MRIFEKQIWHLVILLILIAGIIILVKIDRELLSGTLWNISTTMWLIIALAIPILHQVYVLVCWRLELYNKSLTRKFGKRAFKLYKIGFFIIFVSRMIFIIMLSASNKNTLNIDIFLRYSVVMFISIISIYAFYSVKTYFGMDRAAGIDHFDPEIAKLSFVKKGIFKYTNNGMYLYAFLIIYLPALLCQSKAALVVAIFSHIYIWVHYFCTELPDINKIYNTPPESN